MGVRLGAVVQFAVIAARADCNKGRDRCYADTNHLRHSESSLLFVLITSGRSRPWDEEKTKSTGLGKRHAWFVVRGECTK